jgi:formylglycine-generating enzyme required for sulfatase activity
VEQVSWDDAQAYIKKLNRKTGQHYRLPSEAEWEYACRAGGAQAYCGGNEVDRVAWYGALGEAGGNSGQATHPVGRKQPNALGLYDMSGNVWEWVADPWHPGYAGAPTDGRAWQGDGAKRVIRGGSWRDYPLLAAASYRIYAGAAKRSSDLGLRVARDLP